MPIQLPDHSQHKAVAEAMCGVTKDIVWNHIKDWAENKKPGIIFQCRPGAGRATYHKHKHGSLTHTITFGAEMVQSKTTPKEIAHWTTSREIIERGYYNGELSTLNALAHCCLHEAGHLVQVLLGRRYKGSVHNEEFYQILDRSHQSEIAAQVKDELQARSRRQGIIIPSEIVSTKEAIAIQKPIRKGATVKVEFQGNVIECLVMKVNAKTCILTGIGRWTGTRIRAHKSLLQLV